VDEFSLRLLRFVEPLDPDVPLTTLAVPLINGVPLRELLDSSAEAGIELELLRGPSSEWTGSPSNPRSSAGSAGMARVLTGTCGVADCCGAFARIERDGDQVSWTGFEFGGELDNGRASILFNFDAVDYRRAIARGVVSAPIEVTGVEWCAERPESDEHRYLRSVLGL